MIDTSNRQVDMKRVVVSIVLLAFALLLPDQMWAQWVSVDGPYADAGSVFARLGSNLFMATDSYVFRSTNNGESWTPVNNGLPEDGIYSLLGVGTKLYAGTDYKRGALFVSSDSGTSWTKMNPVYLNSGVTDPVFDVTSLTSIGRNLFIGTSTGLVLRSDNEGESWTIVLGGLSAPATLLAQDSVLYAGGYYAHYSTNQGTDWMKLDLSHTGVRVTSFARIETHLFAATEKAGVIHSSDDGITWDTVNNGMPYKTVYTLLTSGSTLFAGTRSGGVYVTTNYGASWSPSNNGLTDTTVTSLIEHGKYLFASTSNKGILRSPDQGASWTEANIGFSGTAIVRSILSKGSHLFAGIYLGGIHRYDGESWRSAKIGVRNESVSSLAVQDSVLFAGFYRALYANELCGVFRSADNGDSWSQCDSELNNCDVTCVAVGDTNVLAGTTRGVYRSTDSGQSWNVINGTPSGNERGEINNRYVKSLAFVGTTIFAGTLAVDTPVGGEVFVSTNFGVTWKVAGLGLNTSAVRSLAVVGTQVFAGTTNTGVFTISGSGDTFTAVPAGLSGKTVISLAVSGTNLFAGTVDGGVFLTTDMGKTWTSINDGLPYSSVTALAVHKGNLYAGAASIVEFWHGAGVFVRPLSEIVTTVNETSASELTPSLLSQNYPNPFTNVTDIEFTLRESAHVTIVIYNALGAIVQTIASKEFPAGHNTATWDATSHEVGLYFYRINVGSQSETKSLVIMR